ncbi:DNA methyltransferase [Stenotrophomonas indicatrix]|uniref:DNA methyltransferase n=1 Tax=Stenotrophomonas indicatrix TaxID=2045451 RepID=UPI00320AFCCC
MEITDVGQLRDGPLLRAPAGADWDTHAAKEPRIHRIHPYPAKFPAFLAERAINYATSEGVRVRTVGDIFCGCGTVAHEARRLGLGFWGCDINPVATLIARTKSADVCPNEFRQAAVKALRKAHRARADINLAAPARERLERWFRPEQFADLARILNAIRAVAPQPSPLHDALLCTFSAILKPCSQWQVRAIKPTLDLSKEPPDAFATFEKHALNVYQAVEEAGDLSRSPEAVIELGSALQINLPRRGVDLLVSSPPYVTSYEYADLHQLSSLFLGYTDDHRRLRQGSIGSTQHDFRLARGIRDLNRTATRTVFSLYEQDRRAAQSVANYFVDMQAIAVRAKRIVRPGGIAMFVIGNTQYRGVDVDNASHLTESLLLAGFSKIRAIKRTISNKSATPYRTSSGKFSKTRTSNHIYSHEYVLMAHR